MIDAGHGAKDCGAVGVTGLLEKDVNLALAMTLKYVADEMGYDVKATRVDDKEFVELYRRVETAGNFNADLFVSVHSDSATNEKANGTTVFYYNIESMPIANRVSKALSKHLGTLNRESKFADFYVLRKQSERISILIEVAFLSNKEDEAKLRRILTDKEYRLGVAKVIMNSIKGEK